MPNVLSIVRPIIIPAAILAGLLLFAWFTLPRRPVRPEPATPATVGKSRDNLETVTHPVALGSASCTGLRCHGGVDQEYQRWNKRDPHATAYQTLFTPQAQSIVSNLAAKDAPVTAAYQDRQCLTCHVHSRPSEKIREHGLPLEHGIGCEDCHGPASRWLVAHTTAAFWEDGDQTRQDRNERQQQMGMTPLDDAAAMARRCVQCHVGAPADASRGLAVRDVNHDLMAAGHPPLRFEYAQYMNAMPPHWDTAPGEALRSDAARAWALGQLVAATSALELLAHRTSIVWPELAAYDCFACHHELRFQNWRTQRSREHSVRAGLVPSAWYFAALPALAQLDTPTASEAVAALQALSRQLEQPFVHSEEIAQSARYAIELLRVWGSECKQLPFDERQIQVLHSALVESIAEQVDQGWEEIAPLYLGLVSVNRALWEAKSERGEPLGDGDLAVSESLEQLGKMLVFPAKHHSPAEFRDQPEFDKHFQQILATLRR